ncbi:hypothetical protein CYMTET_12569 [Cymbomonas tetramitiformis]|uniref:Uncharacterized protein n=1 Tax=Cymbomonas tetramitiformis TaxID=36881 RepID=A0AAE0GA92_9CHLO|nr:hypothetical protein CYMTET_17483 [Cymbomonas tetramitiformis]KAK3279557.1 hypothetical protein CYMTET_12569 [Cymbomonas tetramitiformis]
MMTGGYAGDEAAATGDDDDDDRGVSPDLRQRVLVQPVYFRHLVTHLHDLARQSRMDFDETVPIRRFILTRGLGRVEVEHDAFTRAYDDNDFPSITVLPIQAITITARAFATDDDNDDDDDVLSWDRLATTATNSIALRVEATAAAEAPSSNASAPLFDVWIAPSPTK